MVFHHHHPRQEMIWDASGLTSAALVAVDFVLASEAAPVMELALFWKGKNGEIW